ncbi:MAG: indolepyruvate ferredoxin oxidoreductase subunit alpha [Caldisericota bacterium]|nr:indolepyruvate ferredoxin oxidoreductase subunit alpha [Caldisericota bacterium]
MDKHVIVEGVGGSRELLLGNEAAVRGALEAGIGVAASYPGTPSSEIGDVLSTIAGAAGVYFEYSANEKVALEVAAAAAACGVRSFTFMKHVGLNVAADSFMTTAYIGTKAGFVILTADDPSTHSSQNEQDNRYYARLAGVPLVEPSNPQEVKDFMVASFDISEQLGMPVLFRTTTRISHMRADVVFGDRRPAVAKGEFVKDAKAYVPVPANSLRMHVQLLARMDEARRLSETSGLTRVVDIGQQPTIGIVTAGSAFNYVMDALEQMGASARILKLGFTYPLPLDRIREFAGTVEQLLVVEELEPLMEQEIKADFLSHRIATPVLGKEDLQISRAHELNVDIVTKCLGRHFGIAVTDAAAATVKAWPSPLPLRPPVLCAGCPHRGTYMAVRRAIRELALPEPIFASDIGCYTLGISAPFSAADYLLSMGSSIGIAAGFDVAQDRRVFAFIGDSTFFHAGLSPLASAVHNKHRMVVTILDNRTTAMTGHQSNPSMLTGAAGEPAPAISIEAVVKAMGASFVRTINPYRVEDATAAYREAIQADGVAIIVAKQICSLLLDRAKRAKGVWQTFRVDAERCTGCLTCIHEAACPAMYVAQGHAVINQDLCDGCSVCSQVCPEHVIEVKR